MPTNNPEVFSLNVPDSVTRGTTFNVPGGKTIHGAGLQVRGTFVGTFSIDGSMDGSAWITVLDFQGGILADITGAITDVLSGHWPFLSVDLTVDTSGLAIVELALQPIYGWSTT